MPWITSNLIVQYATLFIFLPPLAKSPNIIEKNEGLSLVDTGFAPTQPEAVKKKTGHVTLFHWSWGSGMIPNIHSSTRYRERHPWGENFGGFT